MSLPFRVEDSSLDDPPSVPGTAVVPAGGPEAPSPLPKPAERIKQFSIEKLLPRTLTSRLVVGVVGLLVILLVLLSGGTYFALKSYLGGRLNSQLRDAATQFSPALYGLSIGQDQRLYVTSERVWFGVVLSDGRQGQIGPDSTNPPSSLAQSPFSFLTLDADDRAWFIAHPSKIRSYTTSKGEQLKLVSVTLTNGNVGVVGLSTEEVRRTLGRLLLLEILIGVGVIAVAAGVTSWGVRVGLRPLRRVTRTAQEVTAELGPDGSGLNRRVPVDGVTIEVEEVATSVNTLLYAVETEFAGRVRSEERMRQFLADASHELRTPLTSIRGYAELSRLQSTSGEADDSMRRIEVEGNRMARLVEDLLVLARGDQDTVAKREPIEVVELMGEAADVVAGAYPNREIRVEEPATELTVVGDWDQLLRVLINLTTNAAVHTPDGPIRLSAEAGHSPLGPVVALRVTDTGPGLAAEEAQHVFERFWRADKARSRAKGGSGLGMAIVAQIAHTHGGYVQFDSTVERGTTVTVTLPMPFPLDQPQQLELP